MIFRFLLIVSSLIFCLVLAGTKVPRARSKTRQFAPYTVPSHYKLRSNAPKDAPPSPPLSASSRSSSTERFELLSRSSSVESVGPRSTRSSSPDSTGSHFLIPDNILASKFDSSFIHNFFLNSKSPKLEAPERPQLVHSEKMLGSPVKDIQKIKNDVPDKEYERIFEQYINYPLK